MYVLVNIKCFHFSFTDSKLLFHRMDENLDWRHGKIFEPKGNKRLLCYVDDIHLAQVDN